MAAKRHLKLGYIMEGAGRTWSDWRHPEAQADGSTNLGYYIKQAQIAERGKLDFVFIADSVSINERSSPHYLNRFEPLTILSALAAVTSRIGLVATVTSTYSEPYNVARQFASLDHISGGRAAWNVVTSWLEGSAANYGRDEHLEHSVRYRMAAEHLEVVQGLWDSWEDDAFIRNKATGEFFDRSKLHSLDHVGEFFRVKGPLNIARSKQGQPPIFQAGTSEEGRAFAARHADAIFSANDSFETAVRYFNDVKARAAAFGRDPAKVLVLPSASPVIGSTEEETERLFRERLELASLKDALSMLGRYFNDHDFSVYDPDAPFPIESGLANANGVQGQSGRVLEVLKTEKLSLRQVAFRFAAPRGDFVGTPEKVADAMQRWLEGGGSDGFVMFQSLPGQMEVLVDQLLPVLRKRRLFRDEYEGDTLRSHLGIDVPQNRNTVAPQRLAS